MCVIVSHHTTSPPTLEALIRILKAKVRVMQEEVDRLNSECKEKACPPIIVLIAGFSPALNNTMLQIQHLHINTY